MHTASEDVDTRKQWETYRTCHLAVSNAFFCMNNQDALQLVLNACHMGGIMQNLHVPP